jgi:hypothetical protein
VLFELCIRRVQIGKNLQVVGMANRVSGVDINPDVHVFRDRHAVLVRATGRAARAHAFAHNLIDQFTVAPLGPKPLR